jgi:hypothetical protein
MKRFLLIALLFFLVGCATQRFTTETVISGDPLPDLAIEWPPGTQKEEIYTTVIDGRVISVAPLRATEMP